MATALSQPISFIFLISRQGKVRLSKFYETVSAKERTKLTREVAALVLNRCAVDRWRRIRACDARVARVRASNRNATQRETITTNHTRTALSRSVQRRPAKQCNFIEYHEGKIVYKR